jgi:hypothetical protein
MSSARVDDYIRNGSVLSGIGFDVMAAGARETIMRRRAPITDVAKGSRGTRYARRATRSQA